jgi:hypothetical protein
LVPGGNAAGFPRSRRSTAAIKQVAIRIYGITNAIVRVEQLGGWGLWLLSNRRGRIKSFSFGRRDPHPWENTLYPRNLGWRKTDEVVAVGAVGAVGVSPHSHASIAE